MRQVRLDQLPSGEQQVLLLFGELARRRRPGAVIGIDEVENSLHPTLQRLVMWNLHRIAREWEAQVIVATHSLEVINSVRGGAFLNLDFPEDRFDLPAPAKMNRGRHEQLPHHHRYRNALARAPAAACASSSKARPSKRMPGSTAGGSVHRAREITFFPQDGWDHVVDAVADCAPGWAPRRFTASSIVISRPRSTSILSRNRVFCARRGTRSRITCWKLNVGSNVSSRTPCAPSSPAGRPLKHARDTIDHLYQQCLPLSAYNWTVKQARALRISAAFATLSDRDRQYVRHPKGMSGLGMCLPFFEA